ncbi:hypothetical protein D3C72_1636850 [compost metagenome]
MLEHAVVEEVLVDRGQLVLELRLQVFDDFGVALHDYFPCSESGDCRRGEHTLASKPMLRRSACV